MSNLSVTRIRKWPLRCVGPSCDRTTLLAANRLPPGWVAESWPTRDGGTIKIVMCFPCRYAQMTRLAVRATGSEE